MAIAARVALAVNAIRLAGKNVHGLLSGRF